MSQFLSSLYLGRTPPAAASRRRRLLAVLAASVLALALVAGSAPQAQAQDPVTVRLEPATASGVVGDVFTIKVYVDNVPSTGVQGWRMNINFDPAVVQLNPGQSASTYFAGNLYTTGGYNPFSIVTPAADEITLIQALLGVPPSYPSGSNLLLATIQWEAVGSGTSALNTNGSNIFKDALNAVPYSPLIELDGRITVAGSIPPSAPRIYLPLLLRAGS